jgi:hypothetical protein
MEYLIWNFVDGTESNHCPYSSVDLEVILRGECQVMRTMWRDEGEKMNKEVELTED